MAGTADLVLRCFSGLETRDDVLWLHPVLPPELSRAQFSIIYRGQQVRVSGWHANGPDCCHPGPTPCPSYVRRCRRAGSRLTCGPGEANYGTACWHGDNRAWSTAPPDDSRTHLPLATHHHPNCPAPQADSRRKRLTPGRWGCLGQGRQPRALAACRSRLSLVDDAPDGLHERGLGDRSDHTCRDSAEHDRSDQRQCPRRARRRGHRARSIDCGRVESSTLSRRKYSSSSISPRA
jgi:hypothetical protein